MGNRALRLFAVALALGTLSIAAPAGATSERPATAMRTLEQGVLANINALRKQHGLGPLRFSTKLSSARGIARFYPMGSSRYWSVGENLLWSSPDGDPSGALNMWLNSPPHKKNLLSPRWREI